MASSTVHSVRQVSVARVLGSGGVIGAAAAIAALGTFGTFTDSTTPTAVSVQGGVVSIALSAAGGGTSVPLDFAGVVPGASVTRALDLVNDGDSALSSVRLATVATRSSVLDADRVDGLQMTVRSCAVAWSADGSCAGPVRTLLAAGPAVRDVPLTAPASLVAGVTDHLAVTLALPTTAGDAFKGQASELSLTFTATQRDGGAR